MSKLTERENWFKSLPPICLPVRCFNSHLEHPSIVLDSTLEPVNAIFARGVSKHKHSPHHASHSRKQDAFSGESLPQRGRNAFYAGRLNDAIEFWERAAKKHPEIYPALAEAHFRRATMA